MAQRLSRSGYLPAIALVLFMAIPLLWPAIPPLIDLPGHIARYRIQMDIDISTHLGRYFTVEWRLIPNLGVDLLVMALAPLLGLEPAVKLVVVLVLMTTVAGFLWIAHEVHGRVPPTALFALPLAYNYPFQFGFINYCLSMSLALLGFALWLRLGRQQRVRLRAAMFLMIAPMLWVSHIVGWGAFGILAFASGLVIERRAGHGWLAVGWRAAIACLPLALPLLMMLIWRGDSAGSTSGPFPLPDVFKWIVALSRDRWMVFDIASAFVILCVMVAPIALRRSLFVEPLLAVPAGLLWAIALAMPDQIAGSAFAGVRLIPFAAALSILSIRPGDAMNPRHVKAVVAAGLLFVAARIAGHTASFWIADRAIQGELQALDRIGPGTRVLMLSGLRCGNWPAPRLVHVGAMATVRRETFVNGLWALQSSQILGVKYQAGAPFVANPSEVINVSGCDGLYPTMQATLPKIAPSAFDYLWIVDVPPAQWPRKGWVRSIWTNGRSVLYDMKPVRPRVGTATRLTE